MEVVTNRDAKYYLTNNFELSYIQSTDGEQVKDLFVLEKEHLKLIQTKTKNYLNGLVMLPGYKIKIEESGITIYNIDRIFKELIIRPGPNTHHKININGEVLLIKEHVKVKVTKIPIIRYAISIMKIR